MIDFTSHVKRFSSTTTTTTSSTVSSQMLNVALVDLWIIIFFTAATLHKKYFWKLGKTNNYNLNFYEVFKDSVKNMFHFPSKEIQSDKLKIKNSF